MAGDALGEGMTLDKLKATACHMRKVNKARF